MRQPFPPAWVLAGGLGTRLAEAVPNHPKVLAPVGNRPFLDILLDQLQTLGFQRVVLLLGTRHQEILDFLAKRHPHPTPDWVVETSIEPSPLGTGGAVKFAAHKTHGKPFFLINGDTYLDFDPQGILAHHSAQKAVVTLAASHQTDTRRFGRLLVSSEGLVTAFQEKAASQGPGLINGGIYLMDPIILDSIPEGRAVSLEQQIFPRLLSENKRLAAVSQKGSFFDIGTPESYRAFVSFIGEGAHSSKGFQA